MTIEEDIKQKALDIGFDLVGITGAEPISSDDIARLRDWLVRCPDSIGYMKNNFEKRVDPANLLVGAKSVICLGLNFTPVEPFNTEKSTLDRSPAESKNASGKPKGKVALYARYEDYHRYMKDKLFELADFLNARVDTPEKPKFKFCVDSVPIAERSLAQRAGLGFVAKNHMLISPNLGVNILLAEIVTTLDIKPDKPFEYACTECSRCIRACPTGALADDGSFDPNKCISYLTIEHKGNIPPDLAGKIGDDLFGCDRCITNCPFYANAKPRKNTEFKYYPDRATLDLVEILEMTPEQFELRFSDSPILRTGLKKLKTNAQTCLENLNQR